MKTVRLLKIISCNDKISNWPCIYLAPIKIDIKTKKTKNSRKNDCVTKLCVDAKIAITHVISIITTRKLMRINNIRYKSAMFSCEQRASQLYIASSSNNVARTPNINCFISISNSKHIPSMIMSNTTHSIMIRFQGGR